jgi:Fic family protein
MQSKKCQRSVNDFNELHRGWIRESNLIEDIDDPIADTDAFDAWRKFTEGGLTRRSLLGLHWDIMYRRNPRIAGDYRRYNVRVAYHVAPDFKKVPNLMVKWFNEFGDARTSETIRAAHLVFERIHPFADGNGRVGRMIMNYQRIASGLEILVLYAAQRREYYEWFNEKLPKEYGWAARLVNESLRKSQQRRQRQEIGWLTQMKHRGLM